MNTLPPLTETELDEIEAACLDEPRRFHTYVDHSDVLRLVSEVRHLRTGAEPVVVRRRDERPHEGVARPRR